MHAHKVVPRSLPLALGLLALFCALAALGCSRPRAERLDGGEGPVETGATRSAIPMPQVGVERAASAPAAKSELHDDRVEPRTPTAAELALAKTRAKASNALGMDVYKLAAGSPGNVVLSPVSIGAALALAYSGARGDTAKQLGALLRAPRDRGELGRELKALIDAEQCRAEAGGAAKPEDRVTLRIASGLWVQEGRSLLPEFVARSEQDFQAMVAPTDFAADPQQAASLINDWLSKRTAGQIPEALGPSAIDPETVTILANAVYFRAGWRGKFDTGRTKDGEFHLLDGTTIALPMMHDEHPTPYFKGHGFELVELPYVLPDFAMIIVLPEQGGMVAIEPKLGEILASSQSKLASTLAAISMPRVTANWRASLIALLSKLGIKDAFQPGVADFTGMTAKQDLYLQEVTHATLIKVNEWGTEAAAVSVGSGAGYGRPHFVPITIDRPFFFAIVDKLTSAELFVGRIVDPRGP